MGDISLHKWKTGFCLRRDSLLFPKDDFCKQVVLRPTKLLFHVNSSLNILLSEWTFELFTFMLLWLGKFLHDQRQLKEGVYLDLQLQKQSP